MKAIACRTICLALLVFGTTYSSALPTRLKPEDGAFNLRSRSLNDEEMFHRVGKHLLIEFMDCQFSHLDLDYKILLWFAAYSSGAEVLEVGAHTFTPQGDFPAGWTGYALLAESHISIHTWPEYNYVALDIFSCGEKMDVKKTLEFLIKLFKPGSLHYVGVDRGYDESSNA